LWVRQLAWLHATPEGSDRSRAEILKGQEIAELEELEWGDHLISALSEIGFAMPGMSGAVPINYQEIDAWCRLTATVLPWYEPAQLRNLSREYCAELHESKKASRQKPKKDIEVNNEAVADSFKKMLNFFKD
jgi:hypothetical protein